MRPGGKSNGESPFFEKPILSFEKPGRGNVAPIPYPDWSGERRLGERRANVPAGVSASVRALSSSYCFGTGFGRWMSDIPKSSKLS